MNKFMLKILVPGIPVIPGISYILLLPSIFYDILIIGYTIAAAP
jgi:hypothetical protein